MTQNPIKWTRVLFGAGLTLAVAMSPMVYLLLMAPKPDGVARQADQNQSAMGLVSDGFVLGDHRSAFFLVAGIAIAALLGAIAIAAHSQHAESSHRIQS